MKIVTKASIGVAYEESNIYVAFVTKYVPSSSSDPNVPSLETQTPQLDSEWEDFEQPDTIELSVLAMSSDKSNTSKHR